MQLTRPFYKPDIDIINGGAAVERFYYDNKVVKEFMIATVVFGVVGMLAGIYAAVQLFGQLLHFRCLILPLVGCGRYTQTPLYLHS